MVVSLYIHIPFCATKCNYCDFISADKFTISQMNAYIDAVCGEMALLSKQYGRLPLKTVYVGGGTPSILSADHHQQLFYWLRRHFQVLPDAEVTLEANPDSVTAVKLTDWRQSGVNRLSLGAQSADDCQLGNMGRKHLWHQVVQAVDEARVAGFDNLGLDLIYGLPGQTLADWRGTLAAAADVYPQHLSLYGLKLARGTPWGERHAVGELELPDEDDQADMYQTAREYLAERGFWHYEISNFAQPGRHSRHNLIYWRLEPYLGIGVAAASYYESKRWTNTSSLEHYISSISQGCFCPMESNTLTLADEMAEMMILGLRLRQGVSAKKFFQRFGVSMKTVFGEQIKDLLKKELIEQQDDQLTLTKHALPIANEVFVAFI